MAIPSGSGTEVLKRVSSLLGAGDSDTNILDGVANHIYTVLTISVYNIHATNTASIKLKIMESGSTTRFLGDHISVPSRGIFVWNDKFVMSGTDELFVNTDTDSAYFWVSYIVQDWT